MLYCQTHPGMHFVYDVVYQQHIKIVVKINAIQIYSMLDNGYDDTFLKCGINLKHELLY